LPKAAVGTQSHRYDSGNKPAGRRARINLTAPVSDQAGGDPLPPRGDSPAPRIEAALFPDQDCQRVFAVISTAGASTNSAIPIAAQVALVNASPSA